MITSNQNIQRNITNSKQSKTRQKFHKQLSRMMLAEKNPYSNFNLFHRTFHFTRICALNLNPISNSPLSVCSRQLIGAHASVWLPNEDCSLFRLSSCPGIKDSGHQPRSYQSHPQCSFNSPPDALTLLPPLWGAPACAHYHSI